MSEEETSAIDRLRDALVKCGPPELVAQSSKLLGTGNPTILSTQMTELAYELWGLDGMIGYAGNAMLVDTDIVEKKVAEEGDMNNMFHAATMVHGLDVTELLINYLDHRSEIATTEEEMRFVSLYIQVVKGINVEELMSYVEIHKLVYIAVEILNTYLLDPDTRLNLYHFVNNEGSWVDSARLTIVLTNDVPEYIREWVGTYANVEEIESWAQKFYEEVKEDIAGVKAACDALQNKIFTGKINELAKIDFEKNMEAGIDTGGIVEEAIRRAKANGGDSGVPTGDQ